MTKILHKLGNGLYSNKKLKILMQKKNVNYVTKLWLMILVGYFM